MGKGSGWYGVPDRVSRLATGQGGLAQGPGPGWAEEGVPLWGEPKVLGFRCDKEVICVMRQS